MVDAAIILSDRRGYLLKASGEVGPVAKKLREQTVAISTDSRSIGPGELFIALSGPRFNGVEFAEEALARGAWGVVFAPQQVGGEGHQASTFQAPTSFLNISPHMSSLHQRYRDRHFIATPDTLKYLQGVARAHVLEWKKSGGRVMGITGSNGKTTTKEMLAFMVQSLMGDKLLSTRGNFNNHIGVPLTITRLSSRHTLAIIEMGTNRPGEIQALCQIAVPDMGIITNIAAAHVQYLGNEEGVLREKMALYHSVMENSQGRGLFVVNADDPHLRTTPLASGVIAYGALHGEPRVQFLPHGVEIGPVKVQNKFITGKHNLTNLACSFLMARALFPDHSDNLIQRAADFRPSYNRSSWLKRGRSDIFLDAYNANPTSMLGAMEGFLAVVEQKKLSMDQVLWIVGDMNELGFEAPSAHHQLGEAMGKMGALHVVFVGHHSGDFKRGFKGRVHQLERIDEFYPALGQQYLDSFGMVFIKGSRSLKLESLLAPAPPADT